MATPIETKVSEIITPVIEDHGFVLVQVKVSDSVVEVLAEDPKTRNLGVDDCARLSRSISAVMDVEDPISGAYRLEVSSPGIDRPLVALTDFKEFAGFEAKIELSVPDETGQKRFRGRLSGVTDEQIALTTDQGEVSLPHDAVAKAKLLLTDDLIKNLSHKRMIKGENI